MNRLLNKDQTQAVEYNKGPLLIIAGAGTGKTTVVTQRIKYFIDKLSIKPSEILALTFTEKAATEMQTRVDEAMPLGYSPVLITTFHSFCDTVLRESAIHIGLSPDYNLLTETESLQLVKENLFNFELDYFRPLGNPYKYIQAMLSHFSKLRDENVSPSQYLKIAKNENKELAQAYQKYQNLKIEKNVSDFADLIYYTLRLFNERPNMLKHYQDKYKYILVDEYQDTNYAQNEIVRLLSQKTGKITVVCDDDQSIYKFRGASVSNISDFKKHFPQTKIVVLSTNYRSTQKILNSAYKLIQFNNPDRLEIKEKINKKLKALKSGSDNDIQTLEFQTGEQEAEFIADEIKKLNKKFKYKDIAVLVRANSHAELLLSVLEREDLPHQFLGPSKLFSKPVVANLISFLKVIVNPFDNTNFYELLNLDFFKLDTLQIAKIASNSKKQNIDLFELSPSFVKDFIVGYLEKAKTQKAGIIIYDFLTQTNQMTKFVDPQNIEDQRNAQYITRFFEKVKSYEHQNSKGLVKGLVEWIDLLTQLNDTPTVNETDWSDNNAVNVLTVHSSKGLEFPVVFMMSLVSGRFPGINRSETLPVPTELIKEELPQGDFHLQEERRLFYVGMTRAKEKLYFTWAKHYSEKSEKKVSSFVLEASNKISNFQLSVSKQISNLKFQTLKPTSNMKIEQSKLIISYLSYSQIETFKSCEMHYKLRYILNVPGISSSALSFGNTIHKTLKDYYSKKFKEDIIEIYHSNWINEGYLNKQHEEEMKKRGEKYLNNYLKFGINNKAATKLLEYEIKQVLLPKREGESVLKIGGRIDRADLLPDGTLEIIDYKTGENVPDQKDVNKNLQMSFYALLLSLSDNPLFATNIEKIKFSFYFFDKNIFLSTTRTKSDLINTIDEIYKTRSQIENSKFLCTGYFCPDCEYKGICLKN